MTLEFSGDIWFWRGPAPWYFVTVPEPQATELRDVMLSVTYGWGMIPVRAWIGETEWTTSLWPKNGSFILPLKTTVRRAESLDEGDRVEARIEVIR